MHVGVVVVESHRLVELEHDLVERRFPVLAPAITPGLPEDAAAPGTGMRVVGVELQRPADELLSLDIVFPRAAMMQDLGGQHAFVGRQAGRLQASEPILLCCLETSG